MLTRRKKRHTSGEDKSCSINLDHKHSTISCHDMVEVGEKVMMDHNGTIGGLGEDFKQTDYLQVAWLLREKLNDLVDGNHGEFLELGLQSLLDMATLHNIISIDPKMLSPVLWRTLLRELLLLILARLPVLDIIRLRCLSREWRRDMTTINSDINQVCDEVCPTMVAGFSSKVWMCEGFLHSEYIITICDLKTLSTHKSQHSFLLHPIPRNPINNRWSDMYARDGGLICFVSTWRPNKANPLCIVVVNFLTKLRRKLPPLQYVYLTPPQMMHIEVNSETKCYRVVVIGKNIEGRPVVEIYDSSARQWTQATPPLGFIFGIAYRWQYNNVYNCFKCTSQTRSVYDFVEGQLKSCDEKGPFQRASLPMLFQKDCKFVMHKNSFNGDISTNEGYCITKYRSQNNAKEWVKEKSYLCSPFEYLLGKDPLQKWTLKACEGFLIVSWYSSERQHRHLWLLDLATGEWKSLPNFFEWQEQKFVMSRVFWNVMP